jgi:uncharacterized membrane protein
LFIVPVRSLSERLLQTLLYEGGGIALATPVYSLVFDRPLAESLVLMSAFSAAFLVWAPLFNAVWDRIEWRLCARVASDRPHRWRVLHAVALEGTDTILTLPLLMGYGGHSLAEALLVDLGLAALYAAYAYAFHLAFDRLRPVRPTAHLAPGRARR